MGATVLPSKRPSAAAGAPPNIEIIPLGAGQEVGRSCVILRYLGKTVMLDCGIHPGFSGPASLPFFDEVDLSAVDAMLVTHFHLDHCAAVPYVTAHTSFRGRILMTHPTKAIVHTLLKDFVKVSGGRAPADGAAPGGALYTEADLDAAMERTEVCDFHATVDLGGIRVTPYRAGHVLGAAMFLVEIAGARVLYTGDYSRAADRHMPPADLPDRAPHVVIVESTYGVSRHLPRAEREARLCERAHAAVARGGRVLLPVVALGRAQELLLILEEYWERHPELHGVPIYQASGLARRAMGVYRTYIEAMNDDIRAAFAVANPFAFRHVAHLRSAAAFDDSGPCVVLATPSMLQSGVSRELFEAWCSDARNAVIIADFAVAGTLARDVLSGPADVVARDGRRLPLRASVDAVSFSAHADFPQTSEFLDALAPPHVVLVHGEAAEMGRLAKALEQHAAALGMRRAVYTPKLTQAVLVPHAPRREATVVGRLAARPPVEGAPLRGLLVAPRAAGGGFDGAAPPLLLAAEDLPRFTRLHAGALAQRQTVALGGKPWSEVRLALEVVVEGAGGGGDLGTVESNGLPPGEGGELLIGGLVRVRYEPSGGGEEEQGAAADGGGAKEGGAKAAAVGPHAVLEWSGGARADMVADAVVAVLLQAAGTPPGLPAAEAARLKALAAGDAAGAAAAELGVVAAVLGAQFGPARVDAAAGLVHVRVDGAPVAVHAAGGGVRCADDALRARVERALRRLRAALRPCIVEGEH